MVSTASLEDGLLNTSTTSDDTNHGTSERGDRFLLARGHLELGVVVGVADNGAVLARGTGKGSTVAGLLLDGADDGTLRHDTNGQNVTDGQSG